MEAKNCSPLSPLAEPCKLNAYIERYNLLSHFHQFIFFEVRNEMLIPLSRITIIFSLIQRQERNSTHPAFFFLMIYFFGIDSQVDALLNTRMLTPTKQGSNFIFLSYPCNLNFLQPTFFIHITPTLRLLKLYAEQLSILVQEEFWHYKKFRKTWDFKIYFRL